MLTVLLEMVTHKLSVNDQGNVFHEAILDSIDGVAIQQAALHTSGAAGPSGFVASAWKHHLVTLCNSLSLVAKKLSTRYVHPMHVDVFTSSI